MIRSLQETFDHVALHLLKQGARCTIANALTPHDGDPPCAYYGDNGMRCAVGALIPEHIYCSDWNHDSIDMLPHDVRAYLGMGIGPTRTEELLSCLQSLHDHTQPVTWPRDLREIAVRHGLETRVLDTLRADWAPTA